MNHNAFPPVYPASVLAAAVCVLLAGPAQAGPALPPIWDILPAANLLVPSTVLRPRPLPAEAVGAPASPALAPLPSRLSPLPPYVHPTEPLAAQPAAVAPSPPLSGNPFSAPAQVAPSATSTPAPATGVPAPTAVAPVAAAAPMGLAATPPPVVPLGRPTTQGLASLGNDVSQSDAALSLKSANNLAWSNRLEEAITQYQALMRDPAQAQAAQVPLANAYRWTGRPDLALPLYQRAVQAERANADAAEGLEYAEREVRPRTSLEFNTSSDSGDLRNRGGTLTHRWRDASLTQVFEVGTDWRRSLQGPLGPNPRHQGASLRYTNLGLAWQPEITLNAQASPRTDWFGGVKVKLGDLPMHVEVAQENFGITSFSARALASGLTAKRIGVDGSWGSEAGVLSGRASWYSISDHNTLRTASLKFAPSWRPLGLWFKPYVSLDTRDVKFNTPNYWSPIDGSGSAGLGATAEWSEKDWFFYMAGQLGARVYGEAGSSWSASVGGQRWLNRDTALTVNLWGMSSVRDKARYKAHSLSVKVDRLW